MILVHTEHAQCGYLCVLHTFYVFTISDKGLSRGHRSFLIPGRAGDLCQASASLSILCVMVSGHFLYFLFYFFALFPIP